MKRLKFINKVGNDGIQNKYILGSGIGSQSRFVKNALKKRSSNNSTGKCCDFKITSSIKSLIISYVVTNINLSNLDDSQKQNLINQIKTDYATNLNISSDLIIVNLIRGSLIIHVTIKSETPNLENIKNVINNNASINNNVKNNIITILDNIIPGQVLIEEPIISEEVLPSKTEICITPISIVNIVSSPTGNKYVFNNSSTYNPFFKYSLNNGYYEFTNISSSHPIAILNAGKTNLITYTGDNKRFNETLNGTTADGNYDFYDGTIKVYVYGDFDSVSVYCYHHGYMGGENLLTYKNSCSSNPINSPTMTITSTVDDGDTSNDDSISLTFISSLATNNFNVDDITVTNGSISSFTGTGTTYTATFTPSAAGLTTIKVEANTYTDSIGNNNLATSVFNWNYALSSSSTYNIDVGNSGNTAYTLNGNDRDSAVSGNNQQVDLNVGDTIVFNVTASNHPFWIKTTQSTGPGNAVAEVDNNGAEIGIVTWTPATPGIYYYNCEHHSSMYGIIRVNYYDINVVNSGNTAYTLTGNDKNGNVNDNNPDVEFNVGDTIIFDVNATGHPFYIKYASTDSVTLDSGTQGTTNGTLTWTPSEAGSYYYICHHHTIMTGNIIVN
tara:strand:- start:13520 stop:15358 length:1839 start_codon:yes stop_codon:yes gene_type:complete